MPLDCGYRLDILVEDAVAVDVKGGRQVLLTCLRLRNLLLNFNVEVLRNGIRRILNG